MRWAVKAEIDSDLFLILLGRLGRFLQLFALSLSLIMRWWRRGWVAVLWRVVWRVGRCAVIWSPIPSATFRVVFGTFKLQPRVQTIPRGFVVHDEQSLGLKSLVDVQSW